MQLFSKSNCLIAFFHGAQVAVIPGAILIVLGVLCGIKLIKWDPGSDFVTAGVLRLVLLMATFLCLLFGLLALFAGLNEFAYQFGIL